MIYPGRPKMGKEHHPGTEEGVAPKDLATDAVMATRLLRCAIEQVVDWYYDLFVEPHVVAFVAVANRYSPSPAQFEVECLNVRSRWLGKAAAFRLEVSWHKDTAEEAERLRATMQP